MFRRYAASMVCILIVAVVAGVHWDVWSIGILLGDILLVMLVLQHMGHRGTNLLRWVLPAVAAVAGVVICSWTVHYLHNRAMDPVGFMFVGCIFAILLVITFRSAATSGDN